MQKHGVDTSVTPFTISGQCRSELQTILEIFTDIEANQGMRSLAKAVPRHLIQANPGSRYMGHSPSTLEPSQIAGYFEHFMTLTNCVCRLDYPVPFALLAQRLLQPFPPLPAWTVIRSLSINLAALPLCESREPWLTEDTDIEHKVFHRS